MEIDGMDNEWPIDSSLENFTGTDLSSKYCIFVITHISGQILGIAIYYACQVLNMS